LIWDSSDELDLLGDLWVFLPFWRDDKGSQVYLRVDTRSAIEKASSDFEFEVRDLEYTLDLGWRAPFSYGCRNRYYAFVGQQGLEQVDEDGQPWVRYLGVGFEHGDLRLPADPRREPRRIDWHLSGGPVLDEREVEADFLLRADARYWLVRSERFPVLSFEARLDGLLDGDRLNSDISGGPTVSLFLPGGPIASFSLHYQRSRNPLGIGHSAWLVGFHYAGGGGPSRRDPPDVHGTLAGGGGDNRLGAQLWLRFVSPSFARRYQAAIVVDGNILTAEDTGELYYLYDVGLERRSDRFTLGAYFYHRSNHVLAEPNDTVTSTNVLEAGFETANWHRPGRRTTERDWGDLQARARGGYLLDSDFGEDRRWHFRGGLRWRAPLASRWQPYLLLEGEAGDVQRELYAIGVSPLVQLDLQLELRDDEQYFGADHTATLLMARYGF
jgi:hypothetical protein